MKTLLLPLALALCTSCYASIHGSADLIVDGVRLEERHQESLRVDAWTDAGLRIESVIGNVRVEPQAVTSDPITIRATVHETVPGDGYVLLENERLVARSRSGQPVAVGEVSVWTGPITRLSIQAGSGNVAVLDVPLAQALEIETGMGDIVVRNVGAPERLAADTGMGDVEVHQSSPRALALESGMGDIAVEQVQGEGGELSSGMGDLRMRDCSFVRLEAMTGMGDIDCVRTSYDEGDFDSGLGRVSRS